MKRCAIIGSMGYLGRHIYLYLKNEGIQAFCYDTSDNSEPNFKKIDLTNKISLNNIDLNIDYIFFMSGLTGTYSGFDAYDKYISVNELGLLNLLDLIRKSKYRPKIIFPSTRLVYKGKDAPLAEDDEKETRTIYSVNKLACEGYLQSYSYSFDILYTIFRLCVPYGNLFGNTYSLGTIGYFVKTASNGNDILLYGDGSIKRTFSHINDVCYQMIHVAFNKNSNNNIFNIGGVTYSLREVAEIIATRFNVKVVSIPWPEKDLRIESNHTYFSDVKIQNLIGPYEHKQLHNYFEN